MTSLFSLIIISTRSWQKKKKWLQPWSNLILWVLPVHNFGLAVIIQWESYLFSSLNPDHVFFRLAASIPNTVDFTNVLFLHLCVSLLQSEYMGSKLPKGDNKGVVCTFWCEVSVYYIYMYKHLYFSCGNVDIYDNVNIRASGARGTNLIEAGLGS